MAKTTGLASIAGGGFEGHKIDPRKLQVRSGWNSRNFDDPANVEHIETLANSIAVKGVIEPIKVNWEDGKAFIVNGECRYRACMLAIERGTDIKTVPVIADDRYGNDADRLFTQYLANTGKPFTALETAHNFKRLLDLGWNQDDIAKRAGKTQGWVSQTLALLTAPVAVQAMITNGQVSPSLAMQVVRSEGPTAAETALKAGLEASGGARVTRESVGKRSVGAAVKDAIEHSDIDDSPEDVVIITMPADKFEVLRDLLKL